MWQGMKGMITDWFTNLKLNTFCNSFKHKFQIGRITNVSLCVCFKFKVSPIQHVQWVEVLKTSWSSQCYGIPW